jgi:transcriptional repressor NrdR
MRCPYCKADNDRVIDSRASSDGFAIRRRRECLGCKRRYTTYERAESTPLRVVKKDGARAAFDQRNIRNGLLRACEKRPVASEQLDAVVERVERQCLEAFDKEVPTKVIGNLIMEELKQLDQVAYVRFASVYREFQDVTEFMNELLPMLRNAKQNDSRGEGADDEEKYGFSSSET